MKLRILGNSIRLRLTQTEVAELAKQHTILETTRFGLNNQFAYGLTLKEVPALEITFLAGKISVILPNSIGIAWANSDEITIRQTIQTSENTQLSVLIEKDFKCKTERKGENEDDMFPNPNC